MDKSIYYKKQEYKLFGFKIWEKSEQYEGCDIEDCRIIDPLIEQPIDLDLKKKKD